MQVQTETTAIELFEKGFSKSELKEMANEAVGRVIGEGNPLKIAEALCAMEIFIKEVKDNAGFKEYVREEASKYPKCYTSPSGAKIELAEVGSSFDFSKCNDPEYTRLLLEVEDAKLQLKLHQDFLKTVPAKGIEVLRDDELVTIYPPSKSSTSSYKITLSK